MDYSLFDLHKHMRKIDKKGDPLARLNQFINWELFRFDLEAAREKARPHVPKSNAGRKPTDVILLFKMCVIQNFYNLSDESTEQQTLDRFSFQRFLGLKIGESVPDANTLWAFKEMLKKDNVLEALFLRFDAMLRENGFEARVGQIVDATIVPVSVRRDSKEVNDLVKQGKAEAVTEWSDNARRQKDVDARHTKKNSKSFFGYKLHLSVDVFWRFVRMCVVTPAHVHDSQVWASLLMSNVDPYVFGDSAYRSDEILRQLVESGFVPCVSYRAYRATPLTEEQRMWNRLWSGFRSRVEHVFGSMKSRARGSVLLRSKGLARARLRLHFRCLVYNLDRYSMFCARKQQEMLLEMRRGGVDMA